MLLPILVTPAATEPLTVAEVKLHLRIDHAEEDTLLTGYITAARIYVEQRCWISIMVQTWKLFLPEWPDSWTKLPRGPVVSITSIRYQTALNTWVTLANTEYVLRANDTISLAYNMYWPGVSLYGHEPIEITYTAGIGADQALKQAMLLLIGHWYENREAAVVTPGVTTVKAPLAVDSLLYLYEVR